MKSPSDVAIPEITRLRAEDDLEADLHLATINSCQLLDEVIRWRKALRDAEARIAAAKESLHNGGLPWSVRGKNALAILDGSESATLPRHSHDIAAAPAPSPDVGEAMLIDRLWQDLCEKDDRTSPAEMPEMCLIREDEFVSYIREALASLRTDYQTGGDR